MKINRLLLAALSVTVFGAAWGFITCGWLFNWVYVLPPVTVWRPPMDMTPLFWAINYIGYLILSLIFVCVLVLINRGLPGNRAVKGLTFGLVVWSVGTLPGMFATAMFMTVNPLWSIYMTVNELIALPISGLIAAAIALPRPVAEQV